MPAPLVSALLPTYNERENISVLVPKLKDALRHVAFEIIVIDDSSRDGTAEAVREMGASDARVRLLERPGKMGLASAVFDGAQESRGKMVAVEDAARGARGECARGVESAASIRPSATCASGESGTNQEAPSYRGMGLRLASSIGSGFVAWRGKGRYPITTSERR